MISDTISKQIVEAMKAKDEIRVSTLKLLSSELHNAKIDKKAGLTEEDELKVVRSEAKKRKDAIEAYEKVQDKVQVQERLDREKAELKILREFLPKELSDEELEKIVSETLTEIGAKDVKEIGRVIGAVMGKVKGQAEGGRVAALVKSKLT